MRNGVLLIWVMVILAAASPCFAGNNPVSYSAVHVKSHNAKQGCQNLPVILPWYDIPSTYAGFNFDAFPIFFDLTEYKGVEYGMTWPAWAYSAAFTSCSDLTIGGIARPGDEAAHTWTDCQAGAVAIPGWIWLYADGRGEVCLSAPVALDNISVLDCADGLDVPLYDFCADVYVDAPATEPTTWSGVKSLFAE